LPGAATGNIGVTPIIAAAAGTLALSGTAAGDARISGTASGTLNLSGTAAATAIVSGAIIGSLPLAGVSTGSTITIFGVVTGALSFSGFSTGAISGASATVAFSEDLDLFFDDFGVPVTIGAIRGKCIKDMSGFGILDDRIVDPGHVILVRTDAFDNLFSGTSVNVAGKSFAVNSAMPVEDGAFSLVTLK
jgi:hypothetical protein